MSALTAALLAFGVILLVELPDKTLIASLVLSTRYRPRPVLIGVALMFALGAFLLIKESLADEEDVELTQARENAPFWRIVGTSFGVLFAAEWGDASQIATAGLVARTAGAENAIAIGIGAWIALVLVAGLAIFAGKVVVRKVPLRLVHRIAGVLFAAFAVFTAVAAFGG